MVISQWTVRSVRSGAPTGPKIVSKTRTQYLCCKKTNRRCGDSMVIVLTRKPSENPKKPLTFTTYFSSDQTNTYIKGHGSLVLHVTPDLM